MYKLLSLNKSTSTPMSISFSWLNGSTNVNYVCPGNRHKKVKHAFYAKKLKKMLK